jgi:drug/metabolite transporter (DMT)-like permease
MAIILALLSALAYGSSDFTAGVASRRYTAGPITGAAQALGVLTATIAIVLYPGAGPKVPALAWGALSGLGSALGTLSLYHGLAVARMTVVAATSAVLTALLPVIVGIALGNHIGAGAAIGIGIAIPAIVLVSWQPRGERRPNARTGVLYGALSGVGFALLFIALDRAGTAAGAWPLLPGQLVSLAPIAPFAYRGLRARGAPSRRTAGLAILAGLLSGTANLLFLAATGHGELAIVAVLSALYPAVTVIMARIILAESWTRMQAAGLLTAAAAITLVTI